MGEWYIFSATTKFSFPGQLSQMREKKAKYSHKKPSRKKCSNDTVRANAINVDKLQALCRANDHSGPYHRTLGSNLVWSRMYFLPCFRTKVFFLISMITVVQFRAKHATGSQYMLTDKLYGNYFFIWIDLDWLEDVKGGKYFICQKSAKFVFFFHWRIKN